MNKYDENFLYDKGEEVLSPSGVTGYFWEETEDAYVLEMDREYLVRFEDKYLVDMLNIGAPHLSKFDAVTKFLEGDCDE